MKLNYCLSEQELEEALRCVSWKTDKWMYSVHVWVLAALGIGILYEYARNPEKFYLFVMLAMIILLLFGIIYIPPFSRKRKVREMLKRNEEYQIEFLPRTIVRGNDKCRVPLEKGKVRAAYTENVYVIWVDRDWYVIPRRALRGTDENKLRQILEDRNCRFVRLAIDC